MERRRVVEFAFSGRTVGEALAKMLEHVDGDLLDGYPVTHVLMHAGTVYWRVVVVCVDGRDNMALPSPPALSQGEREPEGEGSLRRL